MKTINSNWNGRELKEIVTIGAMKFKIVTGLLNGGGSFRAYIISDTAGLCQILDKGDINFNTAVSYAGDESDRKEHAIEANEQFKTILTELYGEN